MRNMLKLREAHLASKHRAETLAAEVRRATADILDRERETITRLSRAAEFRDPETGAHIQRMSHYSALIARRLGLGDGLRRGLADGRADARRRQARHSRHHPAQARSPDSGRVRGDEAPPADRPRHPQGLVVQHPAPGRDDCADPPREVRRQRLPARARRRGDPDRGPHRRGRRRLRRPHLGAALQAGLADVARDRAAARRPRQPLRPRLRRRPLSAPGTRSSQCRSRYQDEHDRARPALAAEAGKPPAVPAGSRRSAPCVRSARPCSRPDPRRRRSRCVPCFIGPASRTTLPPRARMSSQAFFASATSSAMWP